MLVAEWAWDEHVDVAAHKLLLRVARDGACHLQGRGELFKQLVTHALPIYNLGSGRCPARVVASCPPVSKHGQELAAGIRG